MEINVNTQTMGLYFLHEGLLAFISLTKQSGVISPFIFLYLPKFLLFSQILRHMQHLLVPLVGQGMDAH